MQRKVRFRILVRSPDRGQTCRLSGHDVHTVSVISRHGGYAWAYKLHHLIFHIAVSKYCADNGQRNVLGTDAKSWLPVQIDFYDTWLLYIVSVVQ